MTCPETTVIMHAAASLFGLVLCVLSVILVVANQKAEKSGDRKAICVTLIGAGLVSLTALVVLYFNVSCFH